MYGTAPTPPREIELKLEVAPASLPALKKVPLLRSLKAPPRRTSEVSVYFDTDKHKLRRNGLTLRVRRVGDRHMQTIKVDGNSASFERDEWETEIAGPEPDLEHARGTALEPLANDKLRLKPQFETRVRRTVYPVADDTRAFALTIDRGTIKTGGRSVPVSEIELELERGNPVQLFEEARKLTRGLAAQLGVRSKAERGYALMDGSLDAPIKSVKIELPAGAATREAFRIIGRACLKQIVGNEPALIKVDPEGVHQMRVGLRRLRAAMSLFGGLLRDPQTEAIKAELKWLTTELGPARELDVLVKRVVAPVQVSHAHWDGLPSVSHALAQKREAALARAQDAVTSPRFRALTLEAAAWLEAGDWTAARDDLVRDRGELAIAIFACGQLTRRWRKVRKKGRTLAKLERAAATSCASRPRSCATPLSFSLVRSPESGHAEGASSALRPRAPAGRARRAQRHCGARGTHRRHRHPLPAIKPEARLCRRPAHRPRGRPHRRRHGDGNQSLWGSGQGQAVLAMMPDRARRAPRELSKSPAL